MSVVAAAIGLSAVVGGVTANNASKKAKGAADRQASLDQQQLDFMREQQANFKKLIDDLPEQERDAIGKIAATYSELNLMLEQAKAQGDTQAAAMFQAQRDLVETHYSAELEAIGANSQEYMDLLDTLSNQAVELVRLDEDANDVLKAEYKKESDSAISNLRKMAEASSARVDSILKSGVTPEAAAKISQVQQGVADITRKAKNLEANVGKGGAASRVTAAELEGLKVLGATIASFREEANKELTASGSAQLNLQGAAADRANMLESTRGRNELAARQPFMAAKADAKQLEGQQSLTALGNRNVEIRNLTGAEGESSLAREQAYGRDRMSLVSGQNAAEQAVTERTQDLKGSYTGGQATVAKSMADVMSIQSQNYANMAKESQAQSQALWGQVGKTAIGAVAGYGEGIAGGGSGKSGAVSGALYTGYGIQSQGMLDARNPTKKKTTNQSISF